MIIYSLDILLSRFGTSPLLYVWFCHFLTCIQVSQKACKLVWYFHLLQNFPQFVVINTVKGFCVVNEAGVDVLWNFLAYSMIQWMLAIIFLFSLPFLSPRCTSESSQIKYCRSLTRRILSLILLTYEMNVIVWQFEYSLALTSWEWNGSWYFLVTAEFSKFAGIMSSMEDLNK